MNIGAQIIIWQIIWCKTERMDNRDNLDVASQHSSNYGDVSAQDGNTHVQVVKKVVTGNVVIEGYLKKLKKYLMSSKNFYRVVGKVMLVASNPKK